MSEKLDSGIQLIWIDFRVIGLNNVFRFIIQSFLFNIRPFLFEEVQDLADLNGKVGLESSFFTDHSSTLKE